MLQQANDLPTVEEAQEFKRLVDRGRAAAGLDPIEFLDFDNAVPCNGEACLSATNLFKPVGFDVGFDTISRRTSSWMEPGYTDPGPAALRMLAALGMKPTDRLIPEAIRRVTDAFDARVPGLRDRLVEAGVVAPKEEVTN